MTERMQLLKLLFLFRPHYHPWQLRIAKQARKIY